ncbi:MULTISPECIES: Y-family DNA polymerase [unclassified Rhodanobacter]|uniref:Y-family DNA polymerase n=1 Tax=unclassified Rhodanobacter TaxID=2621553 RepID=UPI0009EEFF9C|nr:DNA polymerase Y family protein [Rhodanobacter sp. FW510-R10]
MLWLACQLPLLALEVPAGRAGVARVAVEGTIRHVCPLALAAGIRPGMRVATAQALLSPLDVRRTDAAQRGRALAELAPRLARITSQVVLVPGSDTLLGEIGGSRRLLGGLAGVRRAARAALADAGVTWRAAIAPTPLAAEMLATHRPGTTIAEIPDLRTALSNLPATALPLPATAHQLLRRIGAQRVGDVLALPRAGLARRLGVPAVTLLERLLGERPDPRENWVPPVEFVREAEWDDPLASVEVLQFPLRRLLGDLAAHVACRGERAATWSLVLRTDDRRETAITVAAAAGTADPRQLQALTVERLAGTPWPGPVVGLQLRLDATREAPCSASLFEQDGDERVVALLDRLRARLGQEAVYGLAPVADPRPERTQRRVAIAGADGAAVSSRRRPAWLLPAPRPWRCDPARLIAGPERMESGWWDGADSRRDYYVARGDAGATWWVYQDLRTDAWFVHGWFG